MFSVRDLNPRPIVNKTIALPTELTEMIPAVGFEPTKHYALELKSSPFDRSGIKPKDMLEVGFEPTPSEEDCDLNAAP